MGSDLTLAIIGCGNMGTAILSGILASTTDTKSPSDSPISNIIATTKSQSSADKLKSQLDNHPSPIKLSFHANYATQAAESADVVILGCKPYLVDEVLATPGLADALAGKLVISVIAGKPLDVLSEAITKNQKKEKTKETVITRAIPNMAASIRESSTLIELPTNPSPSQSQTELINWIFSSIGTTKILPTALFDCGSMLTASLATLSVAVDGILDGCVAEGLKRSDAMDVTAQCLLGLGKLLQEGHHPAVLRESISSPRGCTIQGLLAVEEGGVRAAFAESIVRGTGHLRRVQGKKEF
ncbi:pyrroline-5-carboxylate reductase dimerization-domain-containing protein [Aspergillus karnatakaensis]|uniref:pyrroline-5-carboxylate reductase family protein n=1 Tax=Aspergillus karnatakaensis TaxID=1810916 RepID=UPI003CCDF0CB